MNKEELTIASTEPVSLDDTTPETKTAPVPAANDADTTEVKPSVPTKDTIATKDTTAAKGNTSVPAETEEEAAPPRPARPLSPTSRTRKDLKDAFPLIEDKYIEAVLIASEGRPEPAFTALLFLLDPTFKPEPVVAAQPPPVPRKSSVAEDELLARKLQKEFEREDRRRRARSQRPRRDVQEPVDDDSADDFEQIKETFTQGFEEARTTINGWVSGLSRKFSQDASVPESQGRGERTQSPKLFGALGGSSFNNAKKSNFDEDPEILALDFRKNVDLDEDVPPQLPKRDKKEEKPEETKTEPKTADKWQPLNSDVPVTSDAFLVTDSEDEDKK